MRFQTLLTSLEEGVFIITINRPDKLNALNKTVIEELSAAIDEVYKNTAVKCAVITGAGPKAFVAGADISEFLSMNANEGEELARRGQEMVFNKIERSPKPIIAAVNGFALGGGCELAMSCHFRLASEQAKFGQPEVNLGLIPGYGGTQRLVQLIGKGKSLELMMTAAMINAAEAKELGLVNYVTSAEELLPKAKELLTVIMSKGPDAIAKVISAVNAYYDPAQNGFDAEIRLFGECFGTEEMKEGVGAFLEKRKAAFGK
nr:enoyl-CoA hydratase-related protein [uncultured Lacibacter sp.]